MIIRVGTRGSQLALTQTELVERALKSTSANPQVEIVPIKTLGDRKQGTLKASQSDKKDWVYDLEVAILDGTIDLAVHSGKDCPTDIEAGTELSSILKRESPLDTFIGRLNPDTGQRLSFEELPQGAKVGTASLRRRALLLRLRPDLQVVEHRGNVPTRLRKLDESEDIMGIVLASAGLSRLGLTDLETQQFQADELLPALSQGTLVVQYAQGRSDIQEILNGLIDSETQASWLAERTVAEVLEGDCKSAISIFASLEGDVLRLRSRVMSPDGVDCVEVAETGTVYEAKALGQAVGKQLLDKGADRIIEAARDFSF